ncbi:MULTISPECIES: SdiA-regulated domain-containing protein, partial [Salmonella]
LDGGRKVMSLHRGLCGLRSDIPQAEGITSDDRDTLWIVSEPNLFYRFTRTAAS